MSEKTRVESWRLHVLLEAGYPLKLAEQLAAAQHVDLHEAVELVTEKGWKHEYAAEVLL